MLGRTRLSWLGAGPVAATPAAVKTELEKLAYLRGMDADTLDISVLPAERRRFLAGVGRRLTAQNLARRDDDRRYPILLTLVAESAVDVLDEVLLLFDQALSGRESAARARMTEALAERARGGENRQALLDDILKIVLDPGVSDGQVGARLRRDIGHERMRAAWEARRARLPRDHGHLAMMDASMAYLRQFVPDVLAAVKFAGGPGTDGLLEAAAILAGLYAAKARKVPDGAPDEFVPARWAGYLETARKAGDVTAFRHYWELCVLMALRDGLRSGDVHVPGSRRYADPASFLLTPQQWEPQRLEFCHLVGKPATAADALALADDELHAALPDLEAQLARGGAPGEVRLTAGGELVIPPLTAEDVPADVEALRAEFGALLPRVPAALVVGKICSSKRQQNALASAIKEYGVLRRTVYAARYLADETYRRRIGRQLNKGENVHALKRSLAYAGEGALRRRHREVQAEQMWCLTLATNAVVTWTTEYHGLAVTALRSAGRDIDNAVLAHIWPTHHENVHFYGTHSVDVDGELAKLDADGYRPLRTTTAEAS